MTPKKITYWIKQLIELKRERIEEIGRSYGTTKWAASVKDTIEDEIEELEEIVHKEKYEEDEQRKTLQTKVKSK